MAECSDLDDSFGNAIDIVYEAGNEDFAMFETAADHIQRKVSELDKKTLLYLYAHFKQATEGPCGVPKPGFFDFKGREKWTAWNSLGQEMTKKSAMKTYVEKVREIYPEWFEKTTSGFEGHKNQKAFGPVMSILANTMGILPENQKTLYDYVREGDLVKLQENLDKSNLNLKDDDNMSLLHWACDRGQLEIVCLLLRAGADMNARDSDGQIPLHYASSCGHTEVLVELLKNGADGNIVDNDGLSPRDVALNEATINCFS